MNLWKTMITASEAAQADEAAFLRPAVRKARLGLGEFDGDLPRAPLSDMAHALRTRRQPRPAPGRR